MPGSEIYELEGHAGIRVKRIDSESGRIIDDNVIDWGNFDFNAPNFVYRFVKGETDYSIGLRPTDYFVGYYASQDRRVYEQPLNLDSVAAQRLLALLMTNLQPRNRIYRYNYVKDNCATRVVDMIERATGDSIAMKPSGLRAVTFREAMEYYHCNYPWYQFGINLALGAPLDRVVPDRMMVFSPEAMLRMLDGAVYSDGRPVAGGTYKIVDSSRPAATEGPTPWYLTPMAVAVMILIVGIAVSIRDLKRKSLTRVYYSALYLIFGIAGLILTFLIFVSVHEATSPNWLYLWLNPLCFVPAIGVWVKKAKKLLFCYQIVNFVLLIALLVVFAIGVQHPDAAFYPLIATDLCASAVVIYLYLCSRKKHS